MTEKYIVTIGRQMGSGGREIGKKLANLLNISYFDKEIINLASKKSGLNEEFFEQMDEKNSFSFFDNFAGMQFSKNYLGSETLFEIQSSIIQELADKDSVLFVGRCADYILREYPRRLDIFITATKEDRIKRTAERKNISLKEAEDLNHMIDKRRKEYYNFFNKKSWGQANSYHLCINSSILGIDKSVDLIKIFIEQKFNL
ncbi:Cytidylate kinase [Apibacter mensalis]|uniref:Cytidylate kinase n=1 Tax=Apibacter mensalis TaxID=1586267 RepID=A0A0X3ANT6_9FLAO|nr:cytidylate kinase-like family protein [Apibacter mensalis]CVK16024.1 Cytidylate kinase [Apibacter mensalis]